MKVFLLGVLFWSLVGAAIAYAGSDLYGGRAGEGLCLLLLSAIMVMVLKLGNDVMERLDSLDPQGRGR
jgi:hypothetical protein